VYKEEALRVAGGPKGLEVVTEVYIEIKGFCSDFVEYWKFYTVTVHCLLKLAGDDG